MNSLWWIALPTLLLPIWWHRKKRVQVAAEPLASARFLPRTEPRQMRVWRWKDVVLLILRCLLLACLIAWLADPVLPWRGNTVVVAEGTDPQWVERQVKEAGFGEAARLPLPAGDALAWVRAHEREWKPDARLLVLGDMGEVGDQGPAFHAEVGAYARERGIERLLAHGPQAIHAAMAFGGGRHFDDMAALTDAVRTHLSQCASIAVKGSRFMRMERVVDALSAPVGGEAEGARAA